MSKEFNGTLQDAIIEMLNNQTDHCYITHTFDNVDITNPKVRLADTLQFVSVFYDENKNCLSSSSTYTRHAIDLNNRLRILLYIPRGTKYLKFRFRDFNHAVLTQEHIDSTAITIKGIESFVSTKVLTTLRSLPNGVCDYIEKRGHKYVKVQKCGEILRTLDYVNNAYNSTKPNDGLYIRSDNYSSTDGMLIDLVDGHIDAYNFKLTSGNFDYKFFIIYTHTKTKY